MHIKHIHEMAEELASGLTSDVTKNMQSKDVGVIGAAVDMLKDLCQAEYYAREAKWLEMIGEEEKREAECGHRMYYRGQPRRANGEYASRRRGYAPYYHIPMEYDYDMTDTWPATEVNKMYYTGQVGGTMGSRTGDNYRGGAGGGYSMQRGGMSRYGYSHDEYMAKMQEHKKDETPEGKKKRHEAFTERVVDLADMLAEEMEEMTKEEQQAWRNKLNKLING